MSEPKQPQPATDAEDMPVKNPDSAPQSKRIPSRLDELPPYAKHLLKISVPVSVQLVSKKLSVQEVLELTPGAMVSFDKSCDGPLELVVGSHVVAEGAAVKVGERFGIEIEKMTLPGEHFWTLRKQA
jgi:flagellar motor switch/type III secretory pathway protein FliN